MKKTEQENLQNIKEQLELINTVLIPQAEFMIEAIRFFKSDRALKFSVDYAILLDKKMKMEQLVSKYL